MNKTLMKASDPNDLERYILDPNIAKSEAEWWAKGRIEELERERNEAVSAVQRLSSGQPFEAVVIADVVKRRTAAIERERDALQAKIDALMLEYCPNEMTQEQLDTWAANQRRVSE